MIRPHEPRDIDWILALNATAEIETSPLEREELASMLNNAFCCLVAVDAHGTGLGFLIVFDQASQDDGDNFAWFCTRYPNFVYVDRIVIASAGRGQGIGGKLYQGLFDRARAHGHTLVGCEVNIVPPNPVSLGFHDKIGFKPVEDRQLESGKIVRYLCLSL